MTDETAAEQIERLAKVMGEHTYALDPRLVQPLAEQVEQVMGLVCGQRPEFRRSIPVRATDHDIVIHDVLVKMVRIARAAVAAEREACAGAVDEMCDDVDDPFMYGTLRAVAAAIRNRGEET